MLARRSFLCGATALCVGARPVFADNYPNHPIKMIVPTPAGGPVDTMARIVGNALTPILGQPVVIENRAGAGNTIGSKAAAQAEMGDFEAAVQSETKALELNPHDESFQARRKLYESKQPYRQNPTAKRSRGVER